MHFTDESKGGICAAETKTHTMPDRINKNPANVPGPFYVDESCIDCDMCRTTAPQFFRRHEENGYTYVYRQPITAEEVALADEARNGCPTESIGNAGAE